MIDNKVNQYNDTANLKLIRMACEVVLSKTGFKRFNVFEPNGTNPETGKQEWEVDLWDKNDKLRSVRFVRPPSADKDWFENEIMRQLQGR